MVTLKDGKFGNFQHQAWRRARSIPIDSRASGAGLPKTRKRGKLANDSAELSGEFGQRPSTELSLSDGKLKPLHVIHHVTKIWQLEVVRLQ